MVATGGVENVKLTLALGEYVGMVIGGVVIIDGVGRAT